MMPDSVAVVTGSSRGIGLAIARRLVRDGWRVCLTARSPEPLEAALRELGGPERAIAVPGKADDPAHQADAVGRTIAAFGRLDLLVNNAGINPVYGPLIGLDPAAVRKVFEVNVFAVLGWVRQAHGAWLGAHGGAVVNVASVAGVQPAEGLAPAVRVNAVAPAVVKTDFARKLYEGHEEQLAKRYPAGRLGVPDDVAGAVA